MPKLGTATSETYTRPRFASDTQSSLMKKRTPIKSKKSSSSVKNANGSKRLQRNAVLKSSGIHKKQSNIMKQSKSMQKMIMVLKQQRDRRTPFIFPGSEQTEITWRLENSFVSLRNDLIKDISGNFKKCIGSPAKLASLCREPTEVIYEFEKHVENSFTSPQDETICTKRDDLKNNRVVSSEDHATVDITYTVRLRSNGGEKPEDLPREIEDLHYKIESEKKFNDFLNEDCSENKTQLQDVSAAKNRRRKRKFWFNRKIATRGEHVDVDPTCRTDLQNSRSTKPIDNPQDCSANDKLVMNNVNTQKKGAFQKNVAFNQRAWRPPGISKTWTTESVTSLQPISQKSSQLTEKSTSSSKNKYSSTELVETFNNGSTSTPMPANQSKMLMKENRDPRANRMAKICDHLVEAKQQQRLQTGGAIPKKKSWIDKKIDTKVVDKPDNANPTPPKSKSRHCQTRPFVPKKSTNNSNIKQHRTESLTGNKRSRTLEVIQILKRIIDSVGEDENTNDNLDHEISDNMIQTSSNRDASSRNDELHIFTKDVNLDAADQSFSGSISMQTELNLPSYKKTDPEKDQDLKQNLINLNEADRSSRKSISTQTELDFPLRQRLDAENDQVLKLTRIIATQTSPSCNRNVVEIGCNTSNVVYSDVEVSCNLISLTNLKTELDGATIKDKLNLNDSIHMQPLTVENSKINVEGEDNNENRELPFSGSKETLNIEMNVKSENHDSGQIPAETTNDVARKAEKIMHEKACQVSLKISKNSDDEMNIDIDKHQEFTKSNNHDANSSSINNLSSKRSQLSIYDASYSSEEVTEYPENDVQNEDTVTSELKVEGIPSNLIATFELAAKRARNLHEAVIIYHESLRSEESEKRNEELVEDDETSEFHDDRHCLRYTHFFSRENEDKLKSEHDMMCHFANNSEDFCGFSTCSSSSSSFNFDFERFSRSSIDDYFGIDREEENVVLPENERAISRSILNECSENVKSLMRLLVHRTQEEHALELIQSERNENDENFAMEVATDKTLALPATIKETRFISREILIPFIYCVICTVIFWFLQFSFRCDSAK